jgi:hypothetical protein
MNSVTTLRTRVALLAVAVLMTLGLTTPGAQAARVSYKSGTTTVTPSADAAKALADHGVTASALAPGAAANGGFTFPISRGFVNPTSGRAELVHSGGLKFAKGARSIALRRFVVVATKKRAYLYARTPVRVCKRYRTGRRHHRRLVRHCATRQRSVAVARITDVKFGTDAKSVSGTLKLTGFAARAFNALAGAKVAKAGTAFGTGTSAVKA